MKTLVELLRSREAWLMERILGYALEHGYTKYTSTLVEAWRISIGGLTEAVASAFEGEVCPAIEIDVDTDWAMDPVSRFGLEEARRHRNRGVDIGMFLGLFTYYRQAYVDCLREFLPPGRERDERERVLVRLFDRMSVAFCSEWSSLEGGNDGSGMAATLREMTNEKNRYLTFFESLDHPVIFVDGTGRIGNLNKAAAALLGPHPAHGGDYYALRMGEGAGSICGRRAENVFPWLAEPLRVWRSEPGERFETQAVFPGPDGERTFRVSFNRQPDVSEKFAGVSLVLQDETDRVQRRAQILRAKEELERTFDTISDMVFLMDESGAIIRVNRAFADALAISPREIVGRQCCEVLGCAGTDCAFPEGAFGALDRPSRFPNLPGSYSLRSNLMIDAAGTFIGKVVVFRDVTAAERIRATLTSIENKYKSIFDHAPVGIFQSSVGGGLISVNATMAGMFGFISVDEMLRHYTDIGEQMYADPQDRAGLISEGLMRGWISASEVRLRRKDGGEFWGRLRGRIVRNDEGIVQYVEGFVEDVSASRAARERLARSEFRFRSLAENMSEGLVRVSDAGVVEYCNEHFSLFAEKPAEDLLGASLVSLIYEEDWPKCREMYDSGSCVLPGSRFDLRFKGKDGIRFAIVTPVPILEEGGGCMGAWVLVMDITERRALEAQLMQNQKLDAIGQLAAGIAHEINTPVQYVVNNMWFIQEGFGKLKQAFDMYRDICGDDGAPMTCPEIRAKEEELQVAFYLEEVPQAISENMQGLDRISSIVRSVRQFSHPGHEEHETVDLNDLVTHTVMVSRNEWKYVAEMTTELDPDLPRVVCSFQKIGQVLLNLVVNAAHAIADDARASGTAGRISIETRVRGDMAEIRVDDSGPGIPEEVRHRVFEPFFTTKPVGKGTGQGLFIAHQVVVQEHGGTIDFETELGRGTTFIISLPVRGIGNEVNA